MKTLMVEISLNQWGDYTAKFSEGGPDVEAYGSSVIEVLRSLSSALKLASIDAGGIKNVPIRTA